MFDQDGYHKWTMGPNGDDLHVEGPAFSRTGVRDANHDLGFDCKVLDINGSLANNEPVDCDVEVGIGFTFGLDPCPPQDSVVSKQSCKRSVPEEVMPGPARGRRGSGR